ncbi:hypothetical protein NFC81_05130 [Salinispirillum sp. LH 10-3-1]|uniref:Transporter substrate-binding domain-containing protein n=1 Tax=Salinispirillum sp. LH 10-3-1 TaxID=2952525 RepID=A0AB38YIV2_9GAMM
MVFVRWIMMLLSCWCVTVASASTLTVRVVTITEQPEGHIFYLQVLEEALRLSGHEFEIRVLGSVPQVRAQAYLQAGTTDVFWMIRDAQRDQLYLPVDVRLNSGLIGHRVLMIRPEDQALFDDVTDLESFRKLGLTVGFGRGWIDSLVWAANDLKYYEEPGTWSVMFDKLIRGRGDFDYLSRSVKEIGDELVQHPALVAERNLVLAYDRDEAFYVSQQRPELHQILSESMLALEQSGRLQQLVDAYWGDVLDGIDFDSRLIIELVTP